MKLEDKTFPINLKYIEKVLEISTFRIFRYSVKSEGGHMIVLRAQEYCFHWLTKYFRLISPQGIGTSEGCKGMSHLIYSWLKITSASVLDKFLDCTKFVEQCCLEIVIRISYLPCYIF